jgi:hypothetical protein
MTHHGTGPMHQPNEIAQETVDAVRRALQRDVSASQSEPAPELRTALHNLACEARQKAISPERVLIALKSIWRTLPDVEHARDYDEETRILQRVVAICIKEYFAD